MVHECWIFKEGQQSIENSNLLKILLIDTKVAREKLSSREGTIVNWIQMTRKAQNL